MNITFYSYSGDNAELIKNLTPIKTVSAVLKGDSNSLINPSIEVNVFDGWTNANYCYIERWQRYYFITSANIVTGGVIVFALNEDVLYTYSTQILNQRALIYRQTQQINPLIVDTLQQEQVNEQIQNFAFSGGELLPLINSNNYSFVLTAYSEEF